ncbi:MAG TPA: hypothetical protein VIL26_00300 [Clostridia bacterium]
MDFCPMCYSEASISNSSLNKHKKVNCPVCGEYYYSPPIFDDQKLVICAYIYNAIKNNDVIPIFSDTINQSEINDARIETVTPEILLNYFPKNLHDLINKILLNIAFYIKNIGSKITNIYLTNANDRQYAKKTALLKTLFCVYENNLDQINILLKHLEKDGYIEPIGLGVFSLTLSFKGWLRVEELQRQNAAVNQAFIIISNKELMNEAKESIIKVLSDLKIAAKLWDETKYKKPVTSEIFYEIKRSKLCIIDLTYQKSPVYFEAGYAEALKKPIIYTCKKDFYLKKQFDIIHNNMINWQTPEELYQALHTRISAVIGL